MFWNFLIFKTNYKKGVDFGLILLKKIDILTSYVEKLRT